MCGVRGHEHVCMRGRKWGRGGKHDTVDDNLVLWLQTLSVTEPLRLVAELRGAEVGGVGHVCACVCVREGRVLVGMCACEPPASGCSGIATCGASASSGGGCAPPPGGRWCAWCSPAPAWLRGGDARGGRLGVSRQWSTCICCDRQYGLILTAAVHVITPPTHTHTPYPSCLAGLGR